MNSTVSCLLDFIHIRTCEKPLLTASDQRLPALWHFQNKEKTNPTYWDCPANVISVCSCHNHSNYYFLLYRFIGHFTCYLKLRKMDKTAKIRIICCSFIELSVLACPGVAINQITSILPGKSVDERIKLTQTLVSVVGISLGIACLTGGVIYRYFGQKIRWLAHFLQIEFNLFWSLFTPGTENCLFRRVIWKSPI